MADPLLCIAGPTASGKTDLAIRLAEALNGELVSVDSALVYRGLDIGSAKPDYPHHLVDICDPAEAYSASRFVDDALEAIETITQRGRRPILVGGTMLYYRALLEGLAPMPAADPELRAELESRGVSEGWPALHKELETLDPGAAARIHPNHSQRLVRALEIRLLTGESLDEVHARTEARENNLNAMVVSIAPTERAVLHDRIAKRFDQMMAAGFLDEVRALHARDDLGPELPAVRAVGYRQLWAYLDDECTLDEAIERGIAATRQLAKRQFTWLRKWPNLKWIHTDANNRVETHDFGEIDPASGNPADLLLNYLT